METKLKCDQTSREFHLVIEQKDETHERFMHFYTSNLTPHELGFAIEQGIWNYLDKKQETSATAKERAKRFIDTMLQPPLLHGDDKHKEWLTAELKNYLQPLEKLLEDYAYEMRTHEETSLRAGNR
jgi:hypothetical protein